MTILNTRTQAAFSLIELSVSLIIIALLTATILSGSHLIESARIRTTISEINTYKVAVNSFYSKYNMLPGDFNEATVYWSVGNVSDGNGDGHIAFQNEADVYEGYNAWQHLSNERMVDVPYPGTATTGVAQMGTDIPKAKIKGGYFFAYNAFSELPNDNVIVVGMPMEANTGTTPHTMQLTGALTPKQAHEIDSKIDDGLPLSGNVQSADAVGSNAESCILDPENLYALSLEGADCITGFRLVMQ